MSVTTLEPKAKSAQQLDRSDKRSRLPTQIFLALVVLIIAYLALVPLVFLLWGTFVEEGRLSLDAFERAYSRERLSTLAYNSFIFASGATVLSMVAGTILAYLVARTDIYMKRFVMVASLVPIVIPGLLYTIAWVFLGSARIGLVSRWLEPLLGPEAFDIFSMYGMILVQGFDNGALAFLLMYASFRSMDPSLEESALMSGASLGQVVRRITLPVNKPAVLATALILFVRNLEAFETPALLGMPDGLFVFTSRIWRSLQFPPDYGEAGALSLSLVLLVTIGVFMYQRMQSESRRYATISGKGFRPHVMTLGPWRAAITGLALLYMVVVIVLPFLILLYASFQPFFSVATLESIANGTLENYEFVLTNGPVVRAFTHSIVLGVASATLTMLLMALGAWIVVRLRVRGTWLVDNLAFMPLVVPGLVLGVALIFVYSRIPIAIYGTMWMLLIAYTTKNLPYGMRASVSSMIQISSELEESAKMSGASWAKAFRRIVLPLLIPGFMAGWIYILITSLRELSTALLVYPPGGEVIGVRMWHMYDRGMLTTVAALGIVLIILTSILVVIAQRLGAVWGVKE